MGKSGGRRKKGGNFVAADGHQPASCGVLVNNGVMASPPPVDSSMLLKRAHDLKEEGNHLFQSKDYAGALKNYDDALKLTPKTHPDRAVFHSNRAACLMQMKPVDYNAVITECSLALKAQPGFGRALLRRARAFEALAKFDLAFQDVQSLLAAEPNHRDAHEIARRLRVALSPRHEAQQDLQSRPSPAALGASAVRGAPIAGLGPCLPARLMPKKPTRVPSPNYSKPENLLATGEVQQQPPLSTPKTVSSCSGNSSKSSEDISIVPKDGINTPLDGFSPNQLRNGARASLISLTSLWRPLKLVYGHDIRLAQMPVNCSFRHLREIVAKRFPSSKSVLIKYRDMEGDLVTITGTEELRLAELCVEGRALEEKLVVSKLEKIDSLGLLRLHVVEVESEQEPFVTEEEQEEEEEKSALGEDVCVKVEESGSHSIAEESMCKRVATDIMNGLSNDEEGLKEKNEDKTNVSVDCKEVEIDDWLFEFAQLFRTHVGIDPDAHVDLHELGMELCSEALEETVTSEEAQSLFEMAASKFQEVAALAFFNWGNVHMCAARKRIPLDDSSSKEVIAKQLRAAYVWVRERYALAGQKYEEALRIKPNFYEGLLALGQQHFETAKLQWSFALASKVDFTSWDYLETIKLFDSAEEKMKTATEMWEKLEEQRLEDLKDPSASKDELLKRRRRQAVSSDSQRLGDGPELSPEEAAEQAAAMRSQIHLFWGNMLFERSQVEFRLGLDFWKTNLDAAIERFRLAGASEADVSVVLKNHASTGLGECEDMKPTTGSITGVSE